MVFDNFHAHVANKVSIIFEWHLGTGALSLDLTLKVFFLLTVTSVFWGVFL